MSNDAVLFAVDGPIATITINRPGARNAVNGDVANGIEAALDQVEANDDIWVAIICGNGPVFCAGADLKEVAADGGRSLATKRGMPPRWHWPTESR